MRRTRGFTLMEILIAMALTTIVTASVLAIVRTQLTAFEMQDQIVRTQQNTRAGMDFVETMVRRACGGINSGYVQVYTPTVKSTTGLPCLRHIDGAVASATTFTSTKADYPDALEVVYASGAITAVSKHTALTTTTPSIDVLDICSFAVNDFVILTDKSFANPALFKISAISAGTCPSSIAVPGTLSFGTVNPAPSVLPTITDCVDDGTGKGSCPTSGTPVLKAYTYSIFVSNHGVEGSVNAADDNMLMVDPAGITSITHLDSGVSVQPAVEGVVDFQVAVGNDTSGTGAGTTMDWIGDAWGETLVTPSAATPWNSATLSVMPQYRQVRLSLLLQTVNLYPGTPAAITPFEDRPSSSYPQFTAGQNSQRYRAMRIIVAPRAWNLSE
jgi:prepilin-type N-terminal cleavage/methylation domain-containing protein